MSWLEGLQVEVEKDRESDMDMMIAARVENARADQITFLSRVIASEQVVNTEREELDGARIGTGWMTGKEKEQGFTFSVSGLHATHANFAGATWPTQGENKMDEGGNPWERRYMRMMRVNAAEMRGAMRGTAGELLDTGTVATDAKAKESTKKAKEQAQAGQLQLDVLKEKEREMATEMQLQTEVVERAKEQKSNGVGEQRSMQRSRGAAERRCKLNEQRSKKEEQRSKGMKEQRSMQASRGTEEQRSKGDEEERRRGAEERRSRLKKQRSKEVAMEQRRKGVEEQIEEQRSRGTKEQRSRMKEGRRRGAVEQIEGAEAGQGAETGGMGPPTAAGQVAVQCRSKRGMSQVMTDERGCKRYSRGCGDVMGGRRRQTATVVGKRKRVQGPESDEELQEKEAEDRERVGTWFPRTGIG